jgi:Putative auto-transporter adhesin, head GIN domain/Outer membrane protein beta-barrel domain
MKNLIIKLIVFVFLVPFAFQSEGQETRNLPEFSSISIGNSCTFNISQSDANSITINADQNTGSKIKTEVIEGILNITSSDNIKNENLVIINITLQTLNKLSVSGSAEVKTTNQFNCNKISIESGSAGNLYLDLKANEIQCKMNGIGDVTLTGTAQKLNANVSGAGDLRASNFEVDTAKINVSGIGSARINVKNSLDADVSGLGSIIYKGKPTNRNITISGTGSIRETKSGNREETSGDSTGFRLGRKKFLIIPDDDLNKQNKKRLHTPLNMEFKNWLGVDIGINGLLNYKNSIDLPANGQFLELNYSRSFQLGLNLLEKDFHLYKNYLNIITGLGFDFNHYALQNNTTLISNPSFLASFNDSTFHYKKNTLNVSYIKAPLLLEVNTNKDYKKSFHLAIGVELAYRIHAVTKQTKELNDKHYKVKQRDDFNLQPFRYSAVARLGFRNFTVFANYGLNTLFKKNKGPQVYPFTVGITVNFKN